MLKVIDAPDQKQNCETCRFLHPFLSAGGTGENVTVTLLFQPQDPLETTDTFPADVRCTINGELHKPSQEEDSFLVAGSILR